MHHLQFRGADSNSQILILDLISNRVPTLIDRNLSFHFEQILRRVIRIPTTVNPLDKTTHFPPPPRLLFVRIGGVECVVLSYLVIYRSRLSFRTSSIFYSHK